MSDAELQARFTVEANLGTRMLYQSSTGFERALVDVDSARTLNLPDWLITDQWDPYLISQNNLPFLAWAVSTNLWENGYWSLGASRDWVARQWQYKAYRGTVRGIRMALEQSNYLLVDTVRPEQGFYAAPNISKEEWDTWIHLMPEMRITLAHRAGVAHVDEFFVEPDTALSENEDEQVGGFGFAGDCTVPLDDGFPLYGRYAFIRHDGVDTPMHGIQYTPDSEVLPSVTFERYTSVGKCEYGMVVGADFVGDERFVDFEELVPHIYTLRLDRTYSHDKSSLSLTTLVPSLEPMSPRYERNSDVGEAGPWLFVGDFVGDTENGFAQSHDDADRLLADRVFLLDPEVAEPMTQGISFAGVSRVGIPTFYAELGLDLGTVEPRGSAFVDDWYCGEDFVSSEDPSHIDRSLRAVVDAKAARDTVWVRFTPKRPIRMGDRLRADAKYGDWISVPL